MAQFLPSLVPAVDANGTTQTGAVWAFYAKGTTTPQALSGGATTATSDSSGDFSQLTLDSSKNYRAILTSSAGQVLYDISSVDANLFDAGVKAALDANSKSVSGATWSFYATGSTNPRKVYADPDLTVMIGAVVTADANGIFPEIYLDTSVTYKAVLDVNGTQTTIDPVTDNEMGIFLDPQFTQDLEPHSSWTGSTNTGFASGTAAPTDPTRTTAKPAVRLIDVERQYFNDTLTVSVMAFANNGGTLIGGIDKVRFNFEGNTVDVSTPALRTFTRYDSSTYKLPCYTVTLKKPSGTSGDAHLYIEAFPTDTGMQNRVLGPIQFSPHDLFGTGTIHDLELTVDPGTAEVTGSSYQTFTAAHTYIASTGGFENPRITFAANHGSGEYDIIRGHFAGFSPNGWITIEADVPVQFGKADPFVDQWTAYDNTAAGGGCRPKLDGVWMKGSNITLEMQNMAIYTEYGTYSRGWVFDGVRIQNSDGIAKDWMKGPRVIATAGTGRNFYLDCSVTDIPSTFNDCQIVRGNITSGTWFDYASSADVVAGNKGSDHSSAEWNNEANALTLQYTGAGATATLSISGNRDSSTRTLTAKVNGSSVGTTTVYKPGSQFDTGRDETMQDVVDWINTLTDFTATLVSNDRRASMLGFPGTLHGLNDQDVKTAAVTLDARADLHNDYYQAQEVSGGSPEENKIVYGNSAYDFAGQKLFFSNPTNELDDWFAINNTFHDLAGTGSEDPSQLTSQMGRSVHSHVVVAHNSLGQTMNLRTDDGSYNPDTYCAMFNNVFGDLVFVGSVDGDIVLDGNHTFASTTAPSGATNHSTGGTAATLYADSATGDFAPAGDLLTNSKAALYDYDQAGAVRSGSQAAGALV